MVTLHVGMAKIVCQCFSSIRSVQKHALTFKNLFLVAFISQTRVLQEMFGHTIEGETLSVLVKYLRTVVLENYVHRSKIYTHWS